ncbi:MAG: hypothetical protein ABIK98_12585 [Pseudomonadota bacterium]|uniref:Uncharacterized protein n=1 Tax=Candidatus Desulfatibia profunda TaxID=2841695 RepID=A0A8J6TN17_9BACT|nr:hypothetical protein [Candidatus Desulfatibia profunda]MBL7181211.1 hypothetical protein [Desulfobacterales bacterium]
MEKETFFKYWEVIFLPKISELNRKTNNAVYLQDEKVGLVWQEFEKLNQSVLKKIENPIEQKDRHKVASVLAGALLKIEPLFYPKDAEDPLVFLANEILAFHGSLGIVRSIRIKCAHEEKDSVVETILKKNFIFPPCPPPYEDYLLHIYKSLHYSKINTSFDIFLFAHILFLIESYTILQAKSQIMEKIHG